MSRYSTTGSRSRGRWGRSWGGQPLQKSRTRLAEAGGLLEMGEWAARRGRRAAHRDAPATASAGGRPRSSRAPAITRVADATVPRRSKQGLIAPCLPRAGWREAAWVAPEADRPPGGEDLGMERRVWRTPAALPLGHEAGDAVAFDALRQRSSAARRAARSSPVDARRGVSRRGGPRRPGATRRAQCHPGTERVAQDVCGSRGLAGQELGQVVRRALHAHPLRPCGARSAVAGQVDHDRAKGARERRHVLRP